MKSFFTFAMVTVLLAACSNEPPKPATAPEVLPVGETFYLQGSDHKIMLPKGFRESGRYRLVNDLPILKQDSTMLQGLELFLDRIEFKDSDLDVFVDTASTYHILIISEAGYIPLDKHAGNLIAGMLKDAHDAESAYYAGLLRFEKIASEFKHTRNGDYFKFKHKVISGDDSPLYKMIYFLTNQAQTYFILELSNTPFDLEKFVANIK